MLMVDSFIIFLIIGQVNRKLLQCLSRRMARPCPSHIACNQVVLLHTEPFAERLFERTVRMYSILQENLSCHHHKKNCAKNEKSKIFPRPKIAKCDLFYTFLNAQETYNPTKKISSILNRVFAHQVLWQIFRIHIINS